jgi:hypothetical protein
VVHYVAGYTSSRLQLEVKAYSFYSILVQINTHKKTILQNMIYELL